MSSIVKAGFNRIGNLCLIPVRASEAVFDTSKALVSGVAGTALSILTLGKVERFNHYADKSRKVEKFLPKVFRSVFSVLNPKIWKIKIGKDSLMVGKTVKIFDRSIFKLKEDGGFFERNILCRGLESLKMVHVLGSRVADLFLAVIEVLVSALTLGQWKKINKLVVRQLKALGVVHDVTLSMRKIINPDQAGDKSDEHYRAIRRDTRRAINGHSLGDEVDHMIGNIRHRYVGDEDEDQEETSTRAENLCLIPVRVSGAVFDASKALVSGVAGSVLSILTFGKVKKFNHYADKLEKVEDFLSKVYRSTFSVLNPDILGIEALKESLIAGWVFDRMPDLQLERGSFFRNEIAARGIALLQGSSLLLSRITDLFLAVIAVVVSALTLGQWKQANKFAVRQLEALRVVSDVMLNVRLFINPDQ